MNDEAITIDVRTIPPRERHFSTVEGLEVGKSFQLVKDHDAKPLYYQFQAEMPARFGWEYPETGPDVWGGTITKVT